MRNRPKGRELDQLIVMAEFTVVSGRCGTCMLRVLQTFDPTGPDPHRNYRGKNAIAHRPNIQYALVASSITAVSLFLKATQVR